jgi:putative component of membrane protein insertase Oxa1/YidC/SpoIIIJ protein YidD
MRIRTLILLIFLINPTISMAQTYSYNGIKSIYSRYQESKSLKQNTESKKTETFYKKHISKQISAHCEFHTTCSEFMHNAIQDLGYARGFILGIDRLSRCGSSESSYNYLPSLQWPDDNSLIDDLSYYE